MPLFRRINLETKTAQSGSNAAQTVSVSGGQRRRLLYVTVKYSGPVTQSVTITLKSHAGAAWDTLLQTIELTAASDGLWIPDGNLRLSNNDAVDVLAPAGGAGVTSAVAIYLEIL